MNQHGKTLMEVMVVVAIVGMVAGMAVPNFSVIQSRLKAKCVLEEVASELRLARQLAMTRRDRVRLVFNLDERAIVVRFVDGGTVDHIYYYRDKGIVMDEPSGGPEILFHPSGRTATATTIQLRSQDGDIRTMTVSMTGRVSIR